MSWWMKWRVDDWWEWVGPNNWWNQLNYALGRQANQTNASFNSFQFFQFVSFRYPLGGEPRHFVQSMKAGSANQPFHSQVNSIIDLACFHFFHFIHFPFFFKEAKATRRSSSLLKKEEKARMAKRNWMEFNGAAFIRGRGAPLITRNFINSVGGQFTSLLFALPLRPLLFNQQSTLNFFSHSQREKKWSWFDWLSGRLEFHWIYSFHS